MLNEYDEFIDRLMKSPEIQKTYDEYIIKDITFKEWVVGTVDDMIIPQTPKEINV